MSAQKALGVLLADATQLVAWIPLWRHYVEAGAISLSVVSDSAALAASTAS